MTTTQQNQTNTAKTRKKHCKILLAPRFSLIKMPDDPFETAVKVQKQRRLSSSPSSDVKRWKPFSMICSLSEIAQPPPGPRKWPKQWTLYYLNSLFWDMGPLFWALWEVQARVEDRTPSKRHFSTVAWLNRCATGGHGGSAFAACQRGPRRADAVLELAPLASPRDPEGPST